VRAKLSQPPLNHSVSAEQKQGVKTAPEGSVVSLQEGKPGDGFEPTTCYLQGSCSSIELTGQFLTKTLCSRKFSR
jgi:hypothetical protein